MEVSSHIHALVTLPLKNVPHYSLKRQLGGPQSKCGSIREEKVFCPYKESLCEWSEMFSASTIDGNIISKIFFPPLSWYMS